VAKAVKLPNLCAPPVQLQVRGEGNQSWT